MELNPKVIRANEAFRQGDRFLAKKLYFEIIQEDPQPVYYNNVATIFFGEGDALRALEYYQKAAERGLRNTDLFLSIGACYEKLNDQRLAVAAYDQAIGCDPRSGKAYYLRGRCKRRLNQLSASNIDFERAVDLDFYGL